MKRNICKILVLFLIASIFLSACVTQESNTSSTSSPAVTSGKKDNTQATINELKSKTIKIMGSVATDMWDTRDNQPVYKEFLKWLDSAKLTVEVEAIAQEQYEQVLKTRTAAALDLPDIVNISIMDTPTAVNLGRSGIFQDVKSLVEKYSNGNIKKLQEKYLTRFWGAAILEDGKAYWYPQWYMATYEGSKPFSSIKTPLIRADWLDKLGLKKPTTADEFINALVDMREKDVNGNGKADEVLVFTPSFRYFGPLFGMPSDNISVDVSDHKAKSPWLMKDQLIPYIQFLQNLVAKKVLDTDSLDKPYEYVQQKIKSNLVACQVGYANTDFYSADVAQFNGRYEGVIFKGGAVEPYVQGELPDFVQGKMAITNKCKDPEAAVRFLDIIATPEFAKLHRYGLEGEGHTIVNGVITPNPSLNVRDYNLSGHAVGHFLWPNLFGSLALEQWESLKLPFKDKNNTVVLDFGDNHSTGDHKYYYGDYQLAIQTKEELDTEAKLMPDLKTYMNETITKLALGQYKIEDIDKYISKMKELGLEKMVAIYQARHDRYIK